jgi:multiple sugar transport system substrate-binding protein
MCVVLGGRRPELCRKPANIAFKMMRTLPRLYLLLFLFSSRIFAQQPITLHLAGDEWFLKSLTKAESISDFEHKTGIHVEVIFKNDGGIMSDLDHSAGRDGSPYDIIVVRHRLLGALVAKKEVQPIDSFLADPTLHDPAFTPTRDLFQNWWTELSFYDGHLYGYPFTALTTYLCYRKDLLEDPANQRAFRARYNRTLRPPASWQEYLDLAQFFNRPQDHLYGTYIQGKKSLALWYEWLNFIYSFGGNIIDVPHGWQYGEIVVNSPQNVAATRQYLKEIPFSPPDTLTYGWNEAQSALQQGHVFMGLLWNDQVPFLEDPLVSKVSGKIGYARVPSTGKPFFQLEGLTYLMVSTSQHPHEAYKFLEWAMSRQVQEAVTLQGSVSIRKSTYSNPAIKNLPYTSIFLSSIPKGIPKPTVPESDEMTQAAVQRLFEIVSNQTSPQQGLDTLALDLKKILGGKSRLRYPVK